MPTYEWHELSPRMRFFSARVLPLAILTIGSIALFYTGRNLLCASDSHDWPTTRGLVVESEVGGSDSADDDRPYADIVFEYTVGDTAYTSGRVTYAYGESAERMVQAYPAGSQVTVHYAPSNPGIAVLEPGTDYLTWIVPIFSAALAVAGLMLVFLVPRSMRRQLAECRSGERKIITL